jgi:hypothetical protein
VKTSNLTQYDALFAALGPCVTCCTVAGKYDANVPLRFPAYKVPSQSFPQRSNVISGRQTEGVYESIALNNRRENENICVN